MSAEPLARLATPPLKRMIAPVLFGALASGAQVALLATSAWLITRASEQPPILYLTLAVVAVRAFALSRATFRYLERITAHDSVFRQLSKLRVAWYRKLVPLAPSGLQHLGRGHLLGGLSRDIDQLQDYPLRVVQPLVSSLLVIGVTVSWVVVFAPPAGLVLIVALVVTALLAWWFDRVAARSSQQVIAPLRGELSNAILDSSRRRAVLVAFGHEQQSDEMIGRVDASLVSAERRLAVSQHMIGGIVLIIAGLTVYATAFVTSELYWAGALTGPAFAMVVLLPLAVLDVFASVVAVFAAREGVRVAEDRLGSLVPERIPEEIPEDPETATEELEAITQVRELTLRDFSVTWPGAISPVSKPVTLTLHAGDRLLIRGPSGVGKTSLAHGLIGFLRYSGSYQLDGQEASTLSPTRLRRKVVLIEQSAHLFSTSLRHNLSFAKPEATDDELWQVVDSVGLGHWARDRGGLEESVGERGTAVSGGQAQRIALARALLADAPVLILDEPTAHVDRALADALWEDLLGAAAKMRPDAIVVIISHLPLPSRYVTQELTLDER
jgi:ATP-binding cassette subfamily C protein CydC